MATIQDTPGKAIIQEAYIYNTASGVNVDVSKLLVSLDIYEDIYSPFVYCDMMVLDYDSFASKFPLAGEEFFVLKYKSPRGKVVSYHFFLYKNDSGAATPLSTAKGYVLRGVTLERAFDTGKTVSGAYTGSYAKIAAQIFDDFISKDTGGLQFNYEPSKSVGRYISPQASPLSAIEHCRARSVSTSEAKSPFVFFRNSNGYTFMSLNGLFNQSASEAAAQKTHTYASRTLPAEFSGQVNSGDIAVDIVSFDIATYYDTMSKIDSGAFNTDTYSFDLTTKSFTLRKRYNITDHASKFQLGGSQYYNRRAFAENFANTRCVAYYMPTNMGMELQGDTSTQKDFFPDHAGEMDAYLNLVSEYNIHYTMYGDSNVTAGQVMKIAVPKARDMAPSDGSGRTTNDSMFSGSFLLARVRHTMTFDGGVDYYVRVSAVNGARNMKIEDIKNE